MSDIVIGLLVYLIVSIVAARLFYRAGAHTSDKDDGEKFVISCVGGILWPLLILFRFVTGHW